MPRYHSSAADSLNPEMSLHDAEAAAVYPKWLPVWNTSDGGGQRAFRTGSEPFQTLLTSQLLHSELPTLHPEWVYGSIKANFAE